jgi:hypothetical protein
VYSFTSAFMEFVAERCQRTSDIEHVAIGHDIVH